MASDTLCEGRHATINLSDYIGSGRFPGILIPVGCPESLHQLETSSLRPPNTLGWRWLGIQVRGDAVRFWVFLTSHDMRWGLVVSNSGQAVVFPLN